VPLNFVGKFDPGHASSHAGEPIEVAPHHGSTDTITIADAGLLFTGDFKRSGPDLILSKDGHDLVVQDYFRGAIRAALASPDGAQLSGSIVDALTGHVQYAQADGSLTAAKVIGHVTKVAGSATAIRNGVAIQLNVGDNVDKGDVVQAGASSSVGLTFIDGTVFGLSSNARMVLNEMVYDPNGSSNSSLISLVQGTITFVAGETAKHGDMRVDTPTATMGIRGTAVLVEIDFQVPGQGSAPPVNFQVLVEPSGLTGSYVLYSKTDPNLVLGTVNQAGLVTSVPGSGIPSQSQAPPLTPAEINIIQEAFKQYFPNYVPPNPQGTGGPGSTPANPVPGSSNPDPLKFIEPDLPVGQPKTVPIKLPGDTPDLSPIIIPVTFTVLKAVDVSPVVNKASFSIADQVTIQDTNPSDTLVPYVPGTAKILSVSVVGPGNVPAGLDPATLLTLDVQTGVVSYDPAKFAFLTENQKVVITIGFDSSVGSETFHETLTETINGVNDPPAITAASLAIARGGTVLFTAANLGITDPDSTSFTFKVSGVTHGTFQTTTDGLHWTSATTFTSADLAAGHVRFVQDGSDAAPMFSIQADDGASANHLSNVFTASVAFADVNHAPVIEPPQIADPGPVHAPAGTPDGHGGFAPVVLSNNFTFSDADFFDSHIVTATFDASASNLGPLEGPIGLFAATLLDDSTGGNQGVVNWSLTLSSADLLNLNNPNFLAPGSTVHEVYDVTVNDGHGGTTVRQVSIEIDGSSAGPTSDDWIGGDGEWSSAGNWSPRLPVPGDTAIIVDSTPQVDSNVTVDGVAVSLQDGAGIVVGSGAILTLDDGTSITGGVLTIGSDSALAIVHGANSLGATLDGVSVTNSGTVLIGNESLIDPTLTLDDGTTITGGTLLIGAGNMLDVEPGANNGFGATLDDVGVFANDLCAVIEVGVSNAATLTLGDGTMITGGSLTIGCFSTLEIAYGPDGPGATLDGVSVKNFGNIQVGFEQIHTSLLTLDDDATVTGGALTIGLSGELDIAAGDNGSGATLDGVAVTNNGAIVVDPTGSGAILTFDHDTIVTGGTLTIGCEGELDITHRGDGHGATLDDVAVTNHGAIVVDPTDCGAILTLDDNTVITGGILAIGHDGTLAIEHGSNNIGATLDGVDVINCGTVLIGHAFDDDPTLTLDDGTAIVGGSLTIGSGSTLEIASGSDGPDAALHGVCVSSSGNLQVDGSATLVLDHHTAITGGSVTNDGTIDASGASSIATTGDLNFSNAGTVNVQCGSFDVEAAVTGSGFFTIGDGAELQFGASVAAGETITFQGSTGTLKLDDATHFNGQISGLAGCDGIDLAGFDADDAHVTWVSTPTSTILTVTDEHHSTCNGTAASITLLGNYTQSSFEFSTDHHGGILIVDPPATAPGSTTVTATGTNQTLTGTGPSDNFVFNFTNVGQATVTNFHADTDLLQLRASVFANVQAALDATADDGHGNAVITLDAHDSITLAGVNKAQLHQADFQLV
jgi:Cadherin-like/FecR protein